MSDTPRTDANICDHFWNGKEYVEAVTADFARELERELAAMREQRYWLADALRSIGRRLEDFQEP